jgi:hypothetical protein
MSKKKNLGLKKMLSEADQEGRATIIDGLPYPVGFGKTPKHTRFKPGNSYGKGRKKGSKNLRTVIKEEYDAEVEVTENGKRRKMSKMQILVRQLANKGSAGDLKATAMSFELMRRAGAFSEEPVEEAPPLDSRDLEAVLQIAKLLSTGETEAAGGDTGES